MNWNEAEELMMTARNRNKGKPIGNNKRLYFTENTLTGDDFYTIHLHGNEIMRIFRDRIVPFDGGWRTVTTKARLNEHLPRGFYVFQKNWDWYLKVLSEDENKPFVYDFSDVYYIHNERGVMLCKTHPNYPKMYGDDDE